MDTENIQANENVTEVAGNEEAMDPSVEKLLAAMANAEKASDVDMSLQQVPADAPAEEAPAADIPVPEVTAEAPAAEIPIEEIPVPEVPVEDIAAPVEEAPVVEVAVETPPVE